MSISKYKILSSPSLMDMQAQVNSYLDAHWVLYEGLVIEKQSIKYRGEQNVYFQIMVRPHDI